MSRKPLVAVLAAAKEWLSLIDLKNGVKLTAWNRDLLLQGLEVRSRLATALNLCGYGTPDGDGPPEISAAELLILENSGSATKQGFGVPRQSDFPRLVDSALTELMMCCYARPDAIDLRAALVKAAAALQDYLAAPDADSLPEHPEIDQPYLRGPNKRKARVAKRNQLIDQAKSAGMTTDQALFDFVREQDPSLLARNKTGEQLIDPKSMMRAYKNSKVKS